MSRKKIFFIDDGLKRREQSHENNYEKKKEILYLERKFFFIYDGLHIRKVLNLVKFLYFHLNFNN